jgi:anthranilate/para-aminobenzoate synthase component I
MERLLAKDGTRIWTEPIKGSVPFTGDRDLDEAAAKALSSDVKERAEHTMIVDLLRNDLGRVARVGSVRVASLMECRPFPTVQHLISKVEAELAPTVGLADLLRAVLPGGSVTGAPKRAVCAHLAESEAGPRGFYCGAIGWIGPFGNCLDLALPIRTAQLSGNRLTYWAGGGITRRSVPEKEWQELLLKTRVMAL